MGIFFDFNEIKQSVINEETIFTIQPVSLNINLTADSNRNGGIDAGYFKVVDSTNFDKAEHIARIALSAPTYVYHKDGTGKKPFKLNSKQKKMLDEYLRLDINSSKCQRSFKPKFISSGDDKLDSNLINLVNNLWKYMLYRYNMQMGFKPKYIYEHSVDSTLSYDYNFIPLYFPQPDYTKLN